MQRPDPRKRQAILAVAADLFARRRYDEVRLDELAAAAHIGKGTLYIYFRDKHDLFLSVIHAGMHDLVERLRLRIKQQPDESAWTAMEEVVRGLVDWAYRFPNLFQLMRGGAPDDDAGRRRLRQKRAELAEVIEQVIRRGVRRGELLDPRPDLTAQFVPAFVRSVFRFGPADVRPHELVAHILLVLGRGIRSHFGTRSKP